MCCAQLGTILPILPPWHRLLTARVVPDKRTNRPTTTTQSCGSSRRRAGTPRVREGGPPCRRRSPIAPPPRSLALPHPQRHLPHSQRPRRPIPKLTPSPPATLRHRRHIAAERGLPLTVVRHLPGRSHRPVAVSTALPGFGTPVLTCIDTASRVVECATYSDLCVCVCLRAVEDYESVWRG